MAKEGVIDILNGVRQGELTAILQYMAHHYYLDKLGYPKLGEEAKKESIDEMKHAERLAERVMVLGGNPEFTPLKPPHKKGSAEEMFRADLALEEEAIERLNTGIKVCIEYGDATSRQILDEIVKNEEDHLYALQQHLEHLKNFGMDYLLKFAEVQSE